MYLPDVEVHAALEFLYRSGRFGGTFGVGLSTAVDGSAEVVGASYQRVALASTSSGFAAAAGRAIQTVVASTFPAPGEDWGVGVSVVLYSTTTKATGVVLAVVRLATGVVLAAGGGPPTVAAGVIRIGAS